MPADEGEGDAVTLSLYLALLAAGADWSPAPKPAEDFGVLTQDGRKVQFFRDLVEGHEAVAVNFIFTSCKLVCPASTASFARLQKLAGPDAKLISISVDPAHDSPSVLDAYMRKFNGSPQGWTFVTGDPGTIARLLNVLSARSGASADAHSRGVAVFRGSTKEWTWTSESNSPSHLRELLAEAQLGGKR